MDISTATFSTVWTLMKDLTLNSLSWIHNITIGGVSLLYINLGFVLMITLFAVLLPVLRNSGANELNSVGRSEASRLTSENRRRNKAIASGKEKYFVDSKGRVSGASRIRK